MLIALVRGRAIKPLALARRKRGCRQAWGKCFKFFHEGWSLRPLHWLEQLTIHKTRLLILSYFIADRTCVRPSFAELMGRQTLQRVPSSLRMRNWKGFASETVKLPSANTQLCSSEWLSNDPLISLSKYSHTTSEESRFHKSLTYMN